MSSFTVTVVGADAAKLEPGKVYVVVDAQEHEKEDDDDLLTKTFTLQHAGSYDENMAFTRQTESSDTPDITEALHELKYTIDALAHKIDNFEVHSVATRRPQIKLTTFEPESNQPISCATQKLDNNL